MARRPEVGVERLTHVTANVTTAESPAATPVLRPRDATDARDIVRDAIDRGTRLRIVARGTWLDAGRPVSATQHVSLEQLSGIVDYTPGDLTLTAKAGTTLAEIADATRVHGQWLALTPWGGDAGSLGATVATATAGPMSGTLGTPRDNVIGVEVVSGAGDVVRGGGRVVKNVAGFDLTRLMVGAWGTLGILTEVSVRLRGIPEHEATLAFSAPHAAPALADLLARLRAAAVSPLGLEIVSAKLASQLDIGAETTILARIAGNAESVAGQREALATLASISEVGGDAWTALRAADPPESTIVRFSSPVARFAETWAAADKLAASGAGHAHGTVLRSTIRVAIPQIDHAIPEPAVALLRAGARDVRIFERLPANLWASLAPSAVNNRLARGVRAAFDPDHLLNPGILGEDGS